MKSKILLAISLAAVICFISFLDRKLLKANHGFCLHVIEAQVPSFPNPSLSFPKELFDKPYHYLGKGAQSFVFESQDKKTVIKFYRFPSHLRRFPLTHHPFGYLFSTSRKNIKEHNLKRLELSFHSFFLAAEPLVNETGVLYVHVQPTTDLEKKVHLIDRLGYHYEIPLDTVAFVVQKKGESFLPRFKKELKSGNQDLCKQMLDSLIHVIGQRSKYHITDLDNMDNDNYGWLENKAIHLDIGRFQEKESINVKDEIVRVAHPLIRYLSETSPEMLNYFESQVEQAGPFD